MHSLGNSGNLRVQPASLDPISPGLSVCLVAQSCLTLCNPRDCGVPGSPVHGILQARTLEWVTIPFSRGPPNPGIELGSPTLQADSLLSEPVGKNPKCCQNCSGVKKKRSFFFILFEG